MGRNERILSVDVLRGISVFGIFLVNMYAFSMPYIYEDPFSLANNSFDRSIYVVMDVFAQASFYPLFSFLFGYSFVLLTEKWAENGLNTTTLIVRRMTVLVLIGLLHAVLLWSGDILVTYGLLGFLLLFVRQWGKRTLMITALSVYFISHILFSLSIYFVQRFQPEAMQSFVDEEMGQRAINIYGSGTFIDVTRFRIEEWWYFNGIAGMLLAVLTIFPLFLIGVAFAKSNRFEKNDTNRKFFRKLFLFTFPIGLGMKCLPYVTEQNEATLYVQDLFGGPLLSFAYISLFYILVNGKGARNIWRYFADVGKMSLTNYLFQSFISTFIFYGYGLGLYGKLTYVETTLLVFIIFLFQIVFSHYWFNTFRKGPMEWIWRGLTSGQFSSIKRRKRNDSHYQM
ncbi:DUF418 domain-containing protein [Fervidibacillus albus]|uniref:DUF418 domain-containing protein n=1 Tax=Fervidibacillus albus TaxID=2980026 RepID=A0A9E8RWR0_9BACI|nr:DUF418 domain-containing protein [Fervidibacillus albus]WAA08687.1 DUF418 domain-containing protein [Fervidibacillus albus]